MHDLMILGGGPAGLTAAMYAIQKRLDAVLVTRDLGGKTRAQLRLPFIERHMMINGDELISRFIREIEYLDYLHIADNADRVDRIDGGYAVELASGKVHETRTLIMATGAKPEPLNVPGEQEFLNRGLCYSAISYAQFFIDRSAAVVGDGDLALRAVAELARHASHVTLIATTESQLHSPLGQKLWGLPHVEFMVGYQVKEVRGDHYANKVIIAREGEEQPRALEVDAIFIEKDLTPRSKLVAHLCELDDQGHIRVDERNQTSAAGIFAAGDVANSCSEQVLISLGEGAKAALSAFEYLLKTTDLPQPGKVTI